MLILRRCVGLLGDETALAGWNNARLNCRRAEKQPMTPEIDREEQRVRFRDECRRICRLPLSVMVTALLIRFVLTPSESSSIWNYFSLIRFSAVVSNDWIFGRDDDQGRHLRSDDDAR